MLLLGGVWLYLASSSGERLRPVDPARSLEQPLWPVPRFELLNSRHETVTNSDLAGKVWVAAFIFTRCPGPCPLISRQMSEIQEGLREVEDFHLVSFSVDPQFDRPAVLREYSRLWDADPQRWWFLTEDDEGEMQGIVQDFKIAFQRTEGLEGQQPDITHGTSLLLVDRAGQVRAVFRSEELDVADQVAAAVKILLEVD